MLYDYWQSQCFWLCALIRFKPYWRRSRTQKLTSLISSNTVVHSIWKRGCCGFRFNEVSRSITRFLECPHARFLINSWNVDSDEAIRNVLIIFFFFFYFGVAVRKLNFLRPQISALGRSHLSTAAEPSSSKSNPPVSSSLEYLLSWISVNYLSVWKNRSFIAEGFFFFPEKTAIKKNLLWVSVDYLRVWQNRNFIAEGLFPSPEKLL